MNFDILRVRDVIIVKKSLCRVCENSFVCDDVARAVIVSDDVAYSCCRKKMGKTHSFWFGGSLGESF